ncbi:DUF4255 domain-containing protein [Meridianimarinicoccus roseus]|uniref:DUF4255 domain-containing protein n=1 Tax=Meridianimarinicoccus roseus TaxID=2072018 RepID=UPI001EE65387|nr:DUF4255 domain-containing protein [Meridianimarinicoccus roseus]
MIHEAISYVRREVRDRLALADTDVIIESARVLTQRNQAQGVSITLVNVEEEIALRNEPATERVAGVLRRREPPVALNLYLLFAFEFQAYETSLARLSEVIGIFQSQRAFTPATASGGNPLPPGIEGLIFEMHNMNFEALNNLWGVMGGAYHPSVVYKMRLLRIQSDAGADAPEVTALRLETGLTRRVGS